MKASTADIEDIFEKYNRQRAEEEEEKYRVPYEVRTIRLLTGPHNRQYFQSWLKSPNTRKMWTWRSWTST